MAKKVDVSLIPALNAGAEIQKKSDKQQTIYKDELREFIMNYGKDKKGD